MIFTLSNKGRLKIDSRPLKKMHSYRQDAPEKLEAGGVLLGRFIIDSKDKIIDRVTVPMTGDTRARMQFIREEKRHQKIISSVWKKSKVTCNYLGEWHTHPEKYPTPSRQDLKNWKEILSTRIFSSLNLYFVIIGSKETRVWEGNRRTKKFKRLKRQK